RGTLPIVLIPGGAGLGILSVAARLAAGHLGAGIPVGLPAQPHRARLGHGLPGRYQPACRTQRTGPCAAPAGSAAGACTPRDLVRLHLQSGFRNLPDQRLSGAAADESSILQQDEPDRPGPVPPVLNTAPSCRPAAPR